MCSASGKGMFVFLVLIGRLRTLWVGCAGLDSSWAIVGCAQNRLASQQWV